MAAANDSYEALRQSVQMHAELYQRGRETVKSMKIARDAMEEPEMRAQMTEFIMNYEDDLERLHIPGWKSRIILWLLRP